MSAVSKTKFDWSKQPPVFTQIDWNNPINKGLMFKVPLNEGKGQTVYDLVAKRKGVFHNPSQALGSTVSWANTPKGKAVNFVDSNGQINFGEQPALTVNLPRLSISAWIYPRSMPTEMQIVSSMMPSQFNYGWVFITFADGSLCFFRNRPGQELNFTSAAGSLIVNRWYHVAATQNGPGEPAHLYINGKEVSYQTTNLGTLSGWEDSIAQIITIGGRSPDGHDFDGYINNVAIWNRSLSPKEVQTLYSQPYVGLIQKETINIFAETIIEEPDDTILSTSISGKSRIQQLLGVSISGVTRIERNTSSLQTGRAHIERNESLSISGKSRLSVQNSVNQSGIARIYKPNGLYDGLLSHWKLDETGGTRNDSHSTRHLAEMGGTVGSQTGKIGNAAHFDAAAEYLEVANDSGLQLGSGKSFSGAGWFYYDSSPSGAHILGKWHDSGLEWLLYRNGNSALEFHVTQDGATAFSCFVVSDTVPSLNTWYFVRWWFDVSTGRAYIQINNGAVSQSSATISHVYAGTSPLFVGIAFSLSTPNMRGRIDSLSLWNRVLTSDEGTALYNSGNGLDYEYFGGVESVRSSNQSGVSRIQKSLNTVITGVSRVQKTLLTSVDGKSRIAKSEQSTTNGKTRIQKLFTTNQSGLARIQKSGSLSETGKARIQKLFSNSERGISRIQVTRNGSISSQSKIEKQNRNQISGIARIFVPGVFVTSTQFQRGVASIRNVVNRSISGKAFIQYVLTRNQAGVTRIQKSTHQNQIGLGRIQKLFVINSSAISRVEKQGQIAISGIARIVAPIIDQTNTTSLSGKAAIRKSLNGYLSGRARIESANAQSINGRTMIIKLITQSQIGKASILNQNTVSIVGKARIRGIAGSQRAIYIKTTQNGGTEVENPRSTAEINNGRNKVTLGNTRQKFTIHRS